MLQYGCEFLRRVVLAYSFSAVVFCSVLCAGADAAASDESVPDGMLQLIPHDVARPPFSGGSLPRTESQLGDATLLDVCCVGKLWVAVGERGVVCVSRDGGGTWTTQAVPFECRLTSVCFLTNRLGWVAGSRRVVGRAGGAAVILATRDGGETWRDLAAVAGAGASQESAGRLPGIEQLQFFGLEEALAICAPDAVFGGRTLFRTADGGLTWQGLEADQPAAPWLAMGCFSADAAVLGGMRQQAGGLVSGEVVLQEEPRRTLRNLRGVSADSSGCAWLGGDGGILLFTDDGGVTWRPPEGDLPGGLGDVLDIRTVAHRAELVLAGGFPGRTLLRSEDGGVTWGVQRLPISGVLHRLRVQGERNFVGVGSFGSIVRSLDGGLTWESVRGADRHCGLLNVVTSVESAAWELLAAECAEFGLRSAVWQPAAELVLGAEEFERRQGQLAARQAMMGLSAAELESDWMFPLEQGLQQYSRRALVEGWNRQTDGRLGELLPLRLARAVCAFRPLVVVMEPDGDGDEAGRLYLSALARGLELAAAPAGTVLETAGLEGWRVERVLRRLPRGQRSVLSYSGDDLLEGAGTSIALACRGAGEVMRAGGAGSLAAYGCWPEGVDAVDRLTAGIERMLTSEVRRPALRRSREELEELRVLVRQSRLESAALGGHGALQGAEEAFVANLESAGAGLPEALAEQQLRELARLCLERNNTDGYLAVQQELVRRYPDSESAWGAASELLVMYGSSEVRHYRMKGGGAAVPRVPGGDDGVVGGEGQEGGGVLRPRIEAGAAASFGGSGGSQSSAVHENWNAQGETAWRILQRHVLDESGVARGLSGEASLRRGISLARSQKTGEAATVLTELARRRDRLGLWAESEFQQLQGMRSTVLRTVNLPKSAVRPVLDGRLADGIWEGVEELVLESSMDGAGGTGEEGLRSLAMLSWDDEFLYLGARLGRRSGSAVLPVAAERRYDEPHLDRDRLEFSVDTDRDLLTAFRLTVDETGRTDEACWELSRWNPEWYVAVDSDEQAWRVELAIPLAELSSEAVRPGALWSLRLRRLSPGEPEQQLRGQLPEGVPAVDMGGAVLVRFIRPQPLGR